MVLQEAFSQEEPSPGGRPEDDGNAGQNTSTGYHIKVDELPKPVNIFMIPVRQDAIVKTILQSCREAQGVLQRPLRQDEVDAISYHFAKSLRTVSWGPPVGIAGGAFAAWRTRASWRFPGYTPKTQADGGRFNPDQFGPIRGQMARSAWHLARFQLYGAVGFFAGALLFASYATSVNAVETGGDPRMKDYIDALRKRAQEHRSQLPPNGQRNPVMSQEGQMDMQAQRAAARLGMESQWKRQDVQRRASDYDDMSPTGGAFQDDFNQNPQDASGLMTDEQMQVRDRRDLADTDRAERLTQSNTDAAARRRSAAADRNSHSYKHADDDDSSSLASQQSPQSSYPQGSTWERLRREAATGKQPSRPSPTNNTRVKSEQRDGSTLGDSFAFSNTDEERQLAKTEAQNEFDARVERERHGGDFAEDRKGAWK